jgi:DNA polymerase
MKTETVAARERQKAALDRNIKACRRCTDLNEPKVTESAPGFGSLHSPVAIVGEALCRACMQKQEPLYRGSGRVLDRCYQRAGIAKQDLFTPTRSIVTPGDRDPYPHECEKSLIFSVRH